MLTKRVQELIVPYKIKNAEYGKEVQKNMAMTTTISSSLVRDDENRIVFGKIKAPEFLFGAKLPLNAAINLILENLHRIVAQITNATLHDAMGTSMLLGCADGAEMNSLPKKRKSGTTFQLSPYLVSWSKNVACTHPPPITFYL